MSVGLGILGFRNICLGVKNFCKFRLLGLWLCLDFGTCLDDFRILEMLLFNIRRPELSQNYVLPEHRKMSITFDANSPTFRFADLPASISWFLAMLCPTVFGIRSKKDAFSRVGENRIPHFA